MSLIEAPARLVPPRWGTARRTAEEWCDLGGDPALVKPGDPGWPTLGHEVADVGRRLDLSPMPHQQHIFDVAFELDPFADGFDLWYTEANVWVMRQCGKTMGILFPVGVHRCTRMPKHIGDRQRVSFTMQDRQETRKKFEFDMIPQLDAAAESFRRIVNPKGRPGRSTREWKSSLNNGAEHLLFGRGNYFLIDTPSKKAGHGGTLDLKMADEARFGANSQIESSAGPAGITRTARQLWVASTAGDEESFWMWPKVVAGRRRVERHDRETRVCSFEYAVPEDADLHDPDVWYEHHPAVGHTIQVDDILDELRKAEDSPEESKIDEFRQEYGNQWIRTPPLGGEVREKPLDPDKWAALKVPMNTPVGGQVALAVHVSRDGRSAAIAVAGRGPDGVAVVDVLSFDAGTFWLQGRIADHRDVWEPDLIGYTGKTSKALAPEIGRGAGVVPVSEVYSSSYAAACESFRLSVVEGRVHHLDQAWLNSAVDGAAKKARGEAWLWDQETSLTDIAPLEAATVALWLLENLPAPEPEEKFFVY